MHTPTIQAMVNANGSFVVSSPIVWKPKESQYEFQVVLTNSLGQPLILGGVILHSLPYRGSIWVRNRLDSKNQVVRLCLRGQHRNKRRDDRRRWTRQSHLHHWSPVHGTSVAEDPLAPPWPPERWEDSDETPLSSGSFKAAIETFCRMHSIMFNTDECWVDAPPPPSQSFVVAPNGEEIP